MTEISEKIRHDRTIVTESTSEQTQFTSKLLKAQCTKMFQLERTMTTMTSGGLTTTSSSSQFVQFDKTGGAMCPCGGGPTGVSQISFSMTNQQQAFFLISDMFKTGLVTKQGDVIPMNKVTPSASANPNTVNSFKVIVVTSDPKLPNLLAHLKGQLASTGKSMDIMVTPLIDGGKDFLASVKA